MGTMTTTETVKAFRPGDLVTVDGALVGEWEVLESYIRAGRPRVHVARDLCTAHVWADGCVKVAPPQPEPPTGSAVLVNDVVWVHGTSHGWHTHGPDGADCLTKKWADIADKATVLHAATIT